MNTVNVAYGMAHGNSGATPSLIILSGPPGTGKTTFARALCGTLAAVHIESDAIRRGLTPSPRYTPAENAAVFARAEAAGLRALTHGQHAIIDATNLTARDRRRFVHLARRLDCGLIFVRLTVPDGVARTRLASPREGFSQATAAIYDRMKGRYQPFSGPAVVVDTRYSIAPSLALVVAMIASAG